MSETNRPTVPAAEAILEKPYKCLDKGFIRLIDYMGSDSSIVHAARVSYGVGTKKVSEDTGLTRYLMRNQHTSPFEMVELKFHVKLPIYVARQWIRHRTANVNEASKRYSFAEDEFSVPSIEDIGFQSTDNKQGRSKEEVPPELQQEVLSILIDSNTVSHRGYSRLIEKKIAKELARTCLPVSLYTEWYWKSDLRNIFHFLELRMDEHAQKEIRVYANVMAGMVKEIYPVSYGAFEDYVLNAVHLSRPELDVISQLIPQEAMHQELRTIDSILLIKDKKPKMYRGVQFDNSELREFRDKLENKILH
jgi:thymidylate synthase (FAD)